MKGVTWLFAFLCSSVLCVAIISTPSSAAETSEPVNCVNDGTPCAIENDTDLQSRNYCTSVVQQLISSSQSQNPSYNEASMRLGIYNACYVGYNNGLTKTSAAEALSICQGPAFLEGKETTGVDFPEICKGGYLAAGGKLTEATPKQTTTTQCGNPQNERFLTMPAWYRGVLDEECKPSPDAVGGDISKFIWTIAFNIVEILLNIVAYTCAAFIIIGGYRYMTSGGSIDANTKARKTIVNALIGLIVSIMSVGIVAVIVSRI